MQFLLDGDWNRCLKIVLTEFQALCCHVVMTYLGNLTSKDHTFSDKETECRFWKRRLLSKNHDFFFLYKSSKSPSLGIHLCINRMCSCRPFAPVYQKWCWQHLLLQFPCPQWACKSHHQQWWFPLGRHVLSLRLHYQGSRHRWQSTAHLPMHFRCYQNNSGQQTGFCHFHRLLSSIQHKFQGSSGCMEYSQPWKLHLKIIHIF